jgi:hypothetical protein
MKNIKLIAICAIILLAISCKKDKIKENNCKIATIINGDDSILLTYNASNKVSNIKSIYLSEIINMDFINEGGFYKQIITTNSASLSGSTVNYILNANGYIDSYNITADEYTNMSKFKYDAEGHLIWSEINTTKDGLPYVNWKDSMVYENGNLTKFYVLYGGSTTNYGIYRTVLINYNTLENTAGLYVNEQLLQSATVGRWSYYEDNFPYLFHLFGKGSKNLPLNSTTTFSTLYPGFSYNYEYTSNVNNQITSQTINRIPDNEYFPKINRFYYECN